METLRVEDAMASHHVPAEDLWCLTLTGRAPPFNHIDGHNMLFPRDPDSCMAMFLTDPSGNAFTYDSTTQNVVKMWVTAQGAANSDTGWASDPIPGVAALTVDPLGTVYTASDHGGTQTAITQIDRTPISRTPMAMPLATRARRRCAATA